MVNSNRLIITLNQLYSITVTNIWMIRNYLSVNLRYQNKNISSMYFANLVFHPHCVYLPRMTPVTPWQLGRPGRKLGCFERHLLTRVSCYFAFFTTDGESAFSHSQTFIHFTNMAHVACDLLIYATYCVRKLRD
jgi:hypothetical protein